MRLCWAIFLVFAFFDTTQGIGSSAIKASGKQKVGALITGMAYWAIGIPITCMLVFWQTWGIKGIWVGPTVAVLFNTIAYHFIVKTTDWPTLILEAEKARAKAKEIPEEAAAEDDFKKVKALD